jgi:hypothetical protein
LRSSISILLIELLPESINKFFLDLGLMLPGLHIKIQKSLLSNIHTESFGQPHSIGDIDLLGDWSELDLSLSLHILED